MQLFQKEIDNRQLIWPVVAGLATGLLLVYWRGFFLQHAAMIGIAVMALVYSGVGAVRRLRGLHGEQPGWEFREEEADDGEPTDGAS